MTKCVFCGAEASPFKGVHLIKNDGSTNFLCSSKCRRNALKLKRDRRKLKWTEFYTSNNEKIKPAENKPEKKTEKKESAKPAKEKA